MFRFLILLLIPTLCIAQEWTTVHGPVTLPPVHRVRPADALRINTNVNLPLAIEEAAYNVVVIHASLGGGSANKGSGTYIGNGLVITAAHVTTGIRNIRVTFPKDGVISGTLIGEDRSWDVALVRLSSSPRRAKGCKLGPDVRPGDSIYVCGYSQQELLIRRGQYMGEKACTGGASTDWVEISTPSWPGDSGGAFLREDGSFVGPLWGSDFRTHTIGTQRRRLDRILAGFG